MKPFTGKIVGVEDHGTIVQVWIQARGKVRVLNFDHRMFRHVWEDEGPLKGRRVRVHGRDDEESESLEFLD